MTLNWFSICIELKRLVDFSTAEISCTPYSTFLSMDTPIEKFIGTAMRIKLLDERAIDGVLTVVDPFGNLLLTNLYENSRDKIDPTSIRRREVGLVSVPRDQITRVMIDKRQKGILGDE